MAFDPAAYAASLAGGSSPSAGEFDPAAYAASLAPSQSGGSETPDFPAERMSASEDGPSLLEAGVRGAANGATLGFRDEITAGLRSLLGAKTYQEALGEEREADDRARKAHPWGFGIGQVLGGFAAPGVGEVVGGAGLASSIARGAVVGGVAGLGNSTSEDLSGKLSDAARGGVMGAGIGAILKGAGGLAEGAEGRVAERAAQAENVPAKGIVDRAVDAGLLFHHPVGFVAKKASGLAIKGADQLLAKISAAARNGEPIASLVKEAAASGIPKTAVAAAVAGNSEAE